MSKQDKINEVHLLEQSLSNLLMQKQAFQMDLAETEASTEELSKSSEVFKIVGKLMVKTDKEKAQKDLDEKKKVLKLRIDTLEKQEKSFVERLEKTRKEITG